MTNAQLLQDAFGLIDDAIVDKAVNTYVSKRVSRWPGIIAAAAIVALVILIASPVFFPGERILKTKYYAIYNADGVYTMKGGLGGGSVGSGSTASIAGYSVKFAGLSDMRRIIFEGQLSERALRKMRSFPKAKYGGGILLFDPNNMQDIVVPEGTWVNGLITWYGCAYQFKFSSETLSGSLTYDTIDDSKTRTENMIQKEEHGVTVLSQTFDPERNATETVFQVVSSQRVWKQVVYTVMQGDKSVTFVEDYWDGAEQQVPGKIDFWGTDNGNYFYGSFHNMTERPSVEYLMQFGLKPFEEE